MPLRDHLDLLAQLPFFTLSPREQRALDTFNERYDAALKEHKTAALARWNTKYPSFVATDSILQSYERIVVEGDLFESAQRQRWAKAYPAFKAPPTISEEYTKIGDYRKISLLKIKLPSALLALNPHRIVTLAFAPGGENFYHYYNHYLNDAIKIHANQQALHNHSTAYFYEYLNQLDDADFAAQFIDDTEALPELYKQLIALLPNLKMKVTSLALANGKPLELLGSLYIHTKLKEALIAEELEESTTYDPKKPILSRMHYQALMDLSATNGYHYAAQEIVNTFCLKIKNSTDLMEAIGFYDDYQTRYQTCFYDTFKAAGLLLNFSVQKRLFTALNKHTPKDLLFYHFSAEAYQLALKMYSSLMTANNLTQTHKNMLRLFYNADHCNEAITTLCRLDSNGNITTLQDAILYIKNLCPKVPPCHRSDAEFSRIDQQLANSQLQKITIWPEDRPDSRSCWAKN